MEDPFNVRVEAEEMNMAFNYWILQNRKSSVSQV